ncbi:MAG: response regulator transcription factor [Gammaproteobacteria bacterium]|nr:response regulator transcription factor [Gammaproteobacteria bacterium]
MKVLLIDDHQLFRDGMRLVLEKLEANTQVFESSSYEDAQAVIKQHQDLDLILLDLELPGLSDTAALKALRSTLPFIPVVVISSNDNGNKVQQMLDSGAQGYIPKSTNADILINSLKLVLSGGIYIPPEILQKINHSVSISEDTQLNAEDIKLTPRQLEVLQKLAHGLSNKEISTALGMAEPTVRVHIAAILKTFNVSNRTRAARIASQMGLITA